MTQDDFQFEPLRGLPEHLPKGEEILWQGRPSAWAFARDGLLLYWLAVYFLFLIFWRVMASFDQGWGLIIQSTLPLFIFACGTLSLFYLIALILCKTTVYTITTRRVVIRKGAALSFSLNLPFSRLRTAHLKERSDGTGNLALEMKDDLHLSYLTLWPHIRPWMMKTPQPTLRSIPDVVTVGEVLLNAASPIMTRNASETSAAVFPHHAAVQPAE